MDEDELLKILRDFERLRALASTGLLDSPQEERFDRYTKLAAKLLQVPTSLISVIDGERQFIKSAHGLGEPWATRREAPLPYSFCKYTVATGESLIVEDAPHHPVVRNNPSVADGVRAYVGIPLKHEGQSIGTLCVVDGKPRAWTEHDLDTLRSLADLVTSEIEHASTKRELTEKVELLNALTDSALDAIITTDASAKILFCNQATEEMFLRPRDGLIGAEVTELMPERYREAHRAGVARLASGAEPRVIGRVVELHGLRANGEEFPVELSISRRSIGAREALLTAVIRDITERSRTTEALRHAEEELRLTVEHAPIGIALVAPDGRWLRVNDAVCRILGYSREELLAGNFQQLTHPDDLAADVASAQQLLRGEIPSYDIDKRYIHRSGRIVRAHLAVALVRAEDGQPRFFISQIEDITARTDAEQAALEQGAITRAVLESMRDVVIVAGRDGSMMLLNQEAERLFGKFLGSGASPVQWGPGEGLFLSDKTTRCAPSESPMARALRGESIECELWVRMPGWPEGRWHSVTGNPVRDPEGQLLGAVNVGRDVTARKEMEEQVRRASLTDELTGLYNRRGFTLMAEQQMRLAKRHGDSLHLLFIDLNDMKLINDRHGHDAGDDALIETATLLTRACRSSDIVARLGGDEFVVLAEGKAETVSSLKERILSSVAYHNGQHGAPYQLSLSVGVAQYDPKRPVPLSRLLAEADSAMYEAKRRAKSTPSPDAR